MALLSSLVNAFGASAPIVLGPENAGAEEGGKHWGHGAKGNGFTSIEIDPASGLNNFALGNDNPSWQNSADWRSDLFLLGPVATAGKTVTFSFAYKFPGVVRDGDNILVYFRYFNPTGKSIDQKIIYVGASTGDSAMTGYKTLTRANIFVPPEAYSADIWVTANIRDRGKDDHWASGSALFDDFAVTMAPEALSASTKRNLFRIVLALCLAFPLLTILMRKYGQPHSTS